MNIIRRLCVFKPYILDYSCTLSPWPLSISFSLPHSLLLFLSPYLALRRSPQLGKLTELYIPISAMMEMSDIVLAPVNGNTQQKDKAVFSHSAQI